MGGFQPNNEMMNHLSQMQGIINSLPKNNVTQESNSPPTQISATPTHEQASSQTITQPEFKCDHCQLTFPDENFLKCHNEMHNNENNQVCSSLMSHTYTFECIDFLISRYNIFSKS